MTDQDREPRQTKRASPFREPHETAVERAIREALERGAFADLPHRGRPLPLPDDRFAGDMALGFEVLRGAGFAPAWIEADKEVRRQLEERDRLLAWAERAGPLAAGTIRSRLRATVEAANQAVAAVNALAPTVRQHRRPLRLEDELAELERRFGTDG
jgi:hypothetical protein